MNFAPIVITLFGRPSPWANGKYEADWRSKIFEQARNQIPSAFPDHIRPSRIDVEFRMADGARGDLDNLAKPVLDTLFRQSRKSAHPVGCLFDCDDCHLQELNLRRATVENPDLQGATIRIYFDEMAKKDAISTADPVNPPCGA